MIRKIIHIDEEKCNGCGACAAACHEGAIGIVDGKAKLLRDDYCDGLGDCLPACPVDAIHFVEREAAAYDAAAVQANMRKRQAQSAPAHTGGCPGSRMRSIRREEAAQPQTAVPQLSQLGQWPCQIKLVPVQAPYYQGRGLLIAADCTAFACASFHERFMNGNVTIIGCPKLDEGSYTDKLAAIIAANDISSVTVARMEVPCCGGLERAAAEACAQSGKDIPFEVVTFAVNGDVIS